MGTNGLSNCKEYSPSATGISTAFLLKTYILLHQSDIICLSETCLDSSTSTDDVKLQILGYTLIRSDHRSNTKGGACIYYRSSLLLRVANAGYLHECLSFKLHIGDKIYNFVVLYRSPS